jgi:eukaryotic-like serine/threonine-protein kinase
LAVGKQFGAFTLLRKLARGGMADIFLASRRLEESEELCVIKMMLPSSLRNPQALKLFLGEARLAAQLEHPNIVHIISLDRVDDYYFIAMEYVPGETLFSMLHQAAKVRRPIKPLEAAAVIRQAAVGLASAHALCDKAGKPLNLVHRDVSPSNIILSYDGQVKILDFGIAAAETRTAGFPEGKALGKFSYMSPEQCLGEDLDRRSDIFSLGIVFWELVTGGALFSGQDKRVIVASILDGLIPTPSSCNADVPAEIEDVIMKALRRRSRDRFQTAWEMSEAIEKACGDSLPAESDLSRMMEQLYTKHRADLARTGDVGEELALENLLFDDLDAPVPVREEDPPKRRRGRLPRSTIVLLAIVVVLLAAAAGVVLLKKNHPKGAVDKSPALSNKTGTIMVDSSPRGARISVDGRDTGEITPGYLSDVPLGAELEIGLYKKGFDPWHGKVLLESEDTRRVNALLQASKKPRRRKRR